MFHILPFVNVNANGGMWYPVHILCYYSTIPWLHFLSVIPIPIGLPVVWSRDHLLQTFCPDTSLFRKWTVGFLERKKEKETVTKKTPKKNKNKKNIHLKCGALKISFFRPLTLREMLFCVSNVTGENCNSCFSAENSLNYTTLHVKKYEKWTCLNIKYHSDLKSMSALPLVDGWCHHLHPCIGAGRTICWVRSWRSWHRAGDGVLSIVLILILIQFYCFLKKIHHIREMLLH